MRETERDSVRLQHIVEAIERVQRFLNDKSLEDLTENEILFFAVVKNIEIIGEAAFMLTNEYKEKHPEIPWKDITGMRHVLVHDYYRISPIEVFKVYKENLPVLLFKLKPLLPD